MFLIFSLYLLFSKEEIPTYFEELAKEAIENSLNISSQEVLYETKMAGNYNYSGAEFTLKTIVTAPNTKYIKGYSIKGNFLGIVKDQSFQLNNNNDFSFIDPKQQKIYKIIDLIAFNDSINIYSTNEITLFDIMTNFYYHKKSLERQPFTFWMNNESQPIEEQIVIYINYGSILGYFGRGTLGTVLIDTTFSFKSKFDISIKSTVSVEMIIKYYARTLQNGFMAGTRIFSIKDESNQFNYSNDDFTFLGFIIDIKLLLTLKHHSQMHTYDMKVDLRI